MNLGVQIAFQVSVFISSGCMSGSEVAASRGGCVFNPERPPLPPGLTGAPDPWLADGPRSDRLMPYLVVVVTCVFLRTSDIEHLFVYLWAFCRSSLAKCLALCPLRSGCFVFWLLNCMASLCVLGISPLSRIWSANIFFHIPVVVFSLC